MSQVKWKVYCFNCKKIIEDEYVEAHSAWNHRQERYCFGSPTKRENVSANRNDARNRAVFNEQS